MKTLAASLSWPPTQDGFLPVWAGPWAERTPDLGSMTLSQEKWPGRGSSVACIWSLSHKLRQTLDRTVSLSK